MADSVSVFGGRAPAEVEQLAKHLRTLDRDTFSQMLSAVLKAVDGLDCGESLRLISASGLVSEDSFNHAVAGLYALLKEALSLPSLTQEVFNEDLRALRVSEELIADVSSAVFGNRYDSPPLCYPVHQLITQPSSRSISDTHRGPTLAQIQDFKWRVDVAISTSSLSRALQPSILMQMKLSDGHLHRFEVPVVKFQELRYNVSLILKEMNDIEKRSVLNIQD